MEPGNVSRMDHIGKVVTCNGYALGHNFTGPQGPDAVKCASIWETADAVKKRT